NLRRIKILEEMAQNLYREWFVKFRFPGHENVCMVDSPLGKIPEEWEVRKLSEVCNLVMGQSPKSEFYNDVGEGLPFHQGVTDFGERFPTVRLYCTMQNRLAEAGDILFSVRAPVGRINIAPTQMIIGRGLSAIRHSAGFQWFVFHLLREKFKEEDSMGGGTIFKAVTKSDMRSIELLSADDETHRRFEDMVLPIENQIKNMTKKNETLRQTRDLLLPKLISGELDVSELDIDIRDAA
ncbi:MAG: restriction endonuclease subunit S, partial [Gammaproteobacteria bacterium]|nr:restriction endonuclease subunit S [Gammaproteobacteria bacterium]